MSKIWKVEIMYSDYESSQILTIGLFTDKEKADEVKSKWELFHDTYSKLLKVPDNWNPTDDKWYPDDPMECGFEWEDSYEYQSLSIKYDKIKEFDEIIVTEFELDKDMFFSIISNDPFRIVTDSFVQIMKEFERDYKLNTILTSKTSE